MSYTLNSTPTPTLIHTLIHSYSEISQLCYLEEEVTKQGDETAHVARHQHFGEVRTAAGGAHSVRQQALEEDDTKLT